VILDSTTKRVRAYLAGAVAANQPHFNASWADHNLTTHAFTPGHLLGLLNSATPVEIIVAPASGFRRQVKLISIFNADTANVTVTVEVFDGANQRTWIRAILEPLWTLAWEPGGTWHVYDENGILQTSTAPAGITIEDIDGVPSFTGVTKIQFDQADGYAITQPAAGTVRLDFSGGAASTVYRRWAYMFR